MPTVKWSQSFLTGDERIDAQHRELFSVINALHDGIAQQRNAGTVENIVRALEKYVAEHLATEAELMERAGYPGAPEHLSLHREIEEKAKSLIEQYRSGNLLLGIKVAQFLGQRLTEHVVRADKPMVDWVRAHSELRKQSAQMRAVTSPFAMNQDTSGSQSRLLVGAAAEDSLSRLPVAGNRSKP
jgi:hemerythrin-like metal-binding protein